MSAFQIIAVAITIGLNALDGFDVLAISFAAPGIAKEWGIDRQALGFVLAMELIGMAVGSVALGGVADRIGRRPTILGCLSVMAVGMFMVTTATSITTLSMWRVFTGLGIGGMLAAINAAAAEFSNGRSRDLCVSLMAIGYPVGAVLGGSVAAMLLKTHDWRAVFMFGGAVTAVFIPLVFWRLPETISFLATKQPVNALDRINHTLKRMGHAMADALPVLSESHQSRSMADLFKPALVATTLLITLAYFLHIATFYFILKWVPKIVVDMGFVPSAAAGVLVWANTGGALGGAVLGLLTKRFSVKLLTVTTLVISFVMVLVFGRGQADLQQLATICAVAGFFTNAAVVGLYALFAKVFPTSLRASGTGFAIGVGRGGAALSPIVAGYLFKAGYTLQGVATYMAFGALIAAIAVLFIKVQNSTQPEHD